MKRVTERNVLRTNHPTEVLVLAWLVVILLSAAQPLLAQETREGHVGVPLDWSTRHILFTNGASPEVAARAARDPRSWINWNQRSAYLSKYRARGPMEHPHPVQLGRRAKIDWAMSLGPSGGMPIGESPAKYSFTVTGNYSCTNDFVVYTIGATPSATQANIVAFNNLYTGTASSSCPNGPQTPPTTDYKQPTFMWSYEVGNRGFVSFSDAFFGRNQSSLHRKLYSSNV